MKPAREWWRVDMHCFSDEEAMVAVIEDIQKDAWNAAVEACANEARANLYGELGTIFLDRLEK